MKQHHVEQGTPAWEALRIGRCCASDAPAMMGTSPYKTRMELLEQWVTGDKPHVNPQLQAVFDEGHRTEAAARAIIEAEMLMDFTPTVFTKEIDGIPLLASLDGLSDDGQIIFEHKLWNQKVAQEVHEGRIPEQYVWQLEQQMLVTGIDQVLFVVSDGTQENMEWVYYTPKEGRREELLAGWKLFLEDTKTHAPAEQVTYIPESRQLPALMWEVKGTSIVSNVTDCLHQLRHLAQEEAEKELITDEDFADKEEFTKDVKRARKSLKETIAKVRGEFVSFADFEEVAQDCDKILQRLQSDGERRVKTAKDARKQEIIREVADKVDLAIEQADGVIKPYRLMEIIGPNFDPQYEQAGKGKRTLLSYRAAVEAEGARLRTQIVTSLETIKPNVDLVLATAEEYPEIFNGITSYLMQPTEMFKAYVDGKVSAYIKREELRIQEENKRLEAERERIREEERERLEQTRLRNERQLHDQKTKAHPDKAETEKRIQTGEVPAGGVRQGTQTQISETPRQRIQRNTYRITCTEEHMQEIREFVSAMLPIGAVTYD